jgi:hypothetical protein
MDNPVAMKYNAFWTVVVLWEIFLSQCLTTHAEARIATVCPLAEFKINCRLVAGGWRLHPTDKSHLCKQSQVPMFVHAHNLYSESRRNAQ